MRLCNALIQYYLLIALSLLFHNCHTHEHHNHVDPVTTKYSESAVNIDALTKNIETVTVQKNDFQQHNNNDEHLHDTIDARLQAKHNLRQSVHQHTDDDKLENEQDYINRLNSALENDYKTEHQVQHTVPPTVDIVNNTPSQNQTKDNVQVPLHIQNETSSSSSTTIKTPTEQQTTDELLLTKTSSTTDSPKRVQTLDEIRPPVQGQINEQQPKETIQQNIIKEETISSTQPQQQKEPVNVGKPVTDPIPPSSEQQQQPISNTIINDKAQDKNTPDVKSSPPTPVQVNPSPQPIPDSIQKVGSLDLKSDQEQILKATQPNHSSDSKLEQQQTSGNRPNTDESPPNPFATTLIKEDEKQETTSTLSTTPFPVIKIKENQEQQVPNLTQNITSSDKQQLPEPIQNTDVLRSNSFIATPIEVDQEQQVLNSTQNVTSSDQQQQQLPEPVQNTDALPSNSFVATPIKVDQEQQVLNSTQNATSSDQEQQLPKTIQNISSIDHNTASVQENKQQQVVDSIKRTETAPADVKSNDNLSVQKESSTIVQTPSTPTRVLRSATSKIQQNAKTRQRHSHSKQQEPENITIELTTLPTIEQSVESPTLKPEEPHVETAQKPQIDLNINNDTETQINDQNIKPIDTTDLPRQVHIHDPKTILNELQEELNKTENLSLDEEIENTTTVDSFLINDQNRHLPRILEHEETTLTIDSTIENNTEINLDLTQIDSKTEDTNNPLTSKSNSNPSTLLSNNSDKTVPIEYRQVCWRLPKLFEPSLELVENQTLRFINLLPDYLQTTLVDHIDDREILMNTIWFGSICSMCCLFSFIFLSMGAKRLKQNKHEKEIRARCQQLQQYNNQIELERATFERQNQKLSDEIDELKSLPIRDADEEIFELREKYEHLHGDWKIERTEHEALQKDIDYKQSLIQKHEFDMQKQAETVAYLNDEILRQKQELEKERETIARVQSNDLSLERFEKLQEIIHELKSEITQLKQEKFSQTDQLQQIQEHNNQLDIDNNELTIKMKQLKDLLEQRDETIARIREKMMNDNHDDQEKTTEIGDFLSTVTENNSDNDQQELLSTINNDVEKANQHMRDLHSEIDEKTRRIKEFDSLLNQEKDRCRELETKLKVVLELRERDAHLHIRQLGQTDAELRKARTDTERVRILQQQLELKQQQLDDVQKVLAIEQTKASEESSKLQHETHEKWMEVKRLTRELDGARKECEGLRRQITKYGNSDRSSQEKTMHKPVPQHMNNTGRVSSEPETNGNSPPPLPYQQGENFRPIDRERNDSGAASPSEMHRIRPPIFGLARPPFFPPPFMGHPPHNPFMMGPRFPMPMGGPHGMISPIPHMMTNGSGGGSDANSFEIVDSANITPNSTSYDAQFNGSTVSPTHDDEQQATAKAKKPKKSLKKKTKTSTTTTVSTAKEDV